MDTDTQFPTTTSKQKEIKIDWQLADNSPNFEFRQMFRPKLIEFFEKTNKTRGAYLWAEQKTKEWFKEKYLIPFSAWHYRNRKEKIVEE